MNCHLKPRMFSVHTQNLPQTKTENTATQNGATGIFIIFLPCFATDVVFCLKGYENARLLNMAIQNFQMETVQLITIQTQPFRCRQIKAKTPMTLWKSNQILIYVQFKKFKEAQGKKKKETGKWFLRYKGLPLMWDSYFRIKNWLNKQVSLKMAATLSF